MSIPSNPDFLDIGARSVSYSFAKERFRVAGYVAVCDDEEAAAFFAQQGVPSISVQEFRQRSDIKAATCLSYSHLIQRSPAEILEMLRLTIERSTQAAIIHTHIFDHSSYLHKLGFRHFNELLPSTRTRLTLADIEKFLRLLGTSDYTVEGRGQIKDSSNFCVVRRDAPPDYWSGSDGYPKGEAVNFEVFICEEARIVVPTSTAAIVSGGLHRHRNVPALVRKSAGTPMEQIDFCIDSDSTLGRLPRTETFEGLVNAADDAFHCMFPVETIDNNNLVPGSHNPRIEVAFETRDVGVGKIAPGFVIGEDAIAFDSRGISVADTLYLRDHWDVFPREPRLIRDISKKNDLRVVRNAFLISTVDKCSYFHWHIDSLPTVLIANALQSSMSEPLVLLTQKLQPFQRESLATIASPHLHLMDLDDKVVFADNLFVPTLVSGHALRPSPALLKKTFSALRSASEETGVQSAGDLVYISRQDAARRKMSNEDELCATLERRGFRIVIPGDIKDYWKQVALLRDASIIVGPHGAGLMNIAFAKPGATFIEILTSNYTNQCYFRLSQVSSLKYAAYIHEVQSNGDPHQTRYELNIGAFINFLSTVSS